MKKLLTAGIVALLMLTGCTTTTEEKETIDTVIKFDGELKYFDTFNGNINNFFKQGMEPTQQALTDNDVTIAVSEDSSTKRYRVMMRTSVTERPVVILDSKKAKDKNCSFNAAIALSYWDIDLNIVKQRFENPEKGSFFATNSESTAVYMFTPYAEGTGGTYQAAFLDKKNVLLSIQSGSYNEEINKKGTALPKLNIIFSTTLIGNDTTDLPVNLSESKWKEIFAQMQKLEPRGDEVNFYGLTSGGEIVEATYKKDTCSTADIN